MVDRVHRELTNKDIRKMADTYHAWRGDKDCETTYKDVAGFCKSATLNDIRHHDYVLTPGATSEPPKSKTTESRSRTRSPA